MQGGRWVFVVRRCASGPGGLHNATSSVAPIDSMSRVHSKLKATGDKNQLSSRVGPTTAVLEAVSAPRHPAAGEEESQQVVPMADPNASMWSAPPPKAARNKTSAQRTRIADYYQTRLKEDNVLFAEEDEPFVIGKIPDSKRRSSEETMVRIARRNRGRIMSADDDAIVAMESPTDRRVAFRNYNSNMIHRRGLHTTTKAKQADDPCLPKPLAPQDCIFPKPLKKCVQEDAEYKWPPICKISLCACMPPHPRLCLPSCDRLAKAKLSMGAKPDYECPSFSECLKQVNLKKKVEPECCIHDFKFCETDQIGKARRKPFKWSVERMEKSLGQKYWTKGLCSSGYHTDARNRSFSTSALLADKKNDKECEKTGNMPCHKVE